MNISLLLLCIMTFLILCVSAEEKPTCAITITIQNCPGVTLQVAPKFELPPPPPAHFPAPETSASQEKQSLRSESAPPPQSWWKQIETFVDLHAPKLRITVYQRAGSTWEYVTEHWFELLATGCAGAYVYVNCVMFRLTRFLLARERWSSWKYNLPLSNVMMMPADELVRELISCCRVRIGAHESPLLNIIAELEAEHAALLRYRQWITAINALDDFQHRFVYMCEKAIPLWIGIPVSWIVGSLVHYCSIRHLIYSNEELTKTSTERLARVEYLQRVVMTLLSQCDMQRR